MIFFVCNHKENYRHTYQYHFWKVKIKKRCFFGIGGKVYLATTGWD